MNGRVRKTITDALRDAHDFVDCDKRHKNPEIRAYATRVCEQIGKAIAALEAAQAPVDDATRADALRFIKSVQFAFSSAGCNESVAKCVETIERALQAPQLPVIEGLEAIVLDAMQSEWDDYCGDTGCYPDDFKWSGGNGTLSFIAGRWAKNVAARAYADQQKLQRGE